MSPPPLPQKIRHQVFWGGFRGALRLSGGKLLTERVTDAHQKAEEWMNSHSSYEIVSISSGFATNEGADAIFVTVWYREP